MPALNFEVTIDDNWLIVVFMIYDIIDLRLDLLISPLFWILGKIKAKLFILFQKIRTKLSDYIEVKLRLGRRNRPRVMQDIRVVPETEEYENPFARIYRRRNNL